MTHPILFAPLRPRRAVLLSLNNPRQREMITPLTAHDEGLPPGPTAADNTIYLLSTVYRVAGVNRPPRSAPPLFVLRHRGRNFLQAAIIGHKYIYTLPRLLFL